jgi:putative membrane protein
MLLGSVGAQMLAQIYSECWTRPIAFALALCCAALVYSVGWYRRRRLLPNAVGVWRFAVFMCGVISVGAVCATPLAHLDHQSLTAHMVQHLVLMTVAAPLILLGEPVLTLRQGLPHRFGGSSTGLIRFTAAIGRFFAQPALCWFAGTGCIIFWHVPGVFELGMRSEWLHEFEQITFLVAGLLFWLPVVQQWPNAERRPRYLIALYLFLATLPCDVLSSLLTFCGRVVYEEYGSGSGPIDGAALRDQEFAGSMMWTWVTFVYLIPAVIITISILSDQPQQKRLHAG